MFFKNYDIFWGVFQAYDYSPGFVDKSPGMAGGESEKVDSIQEGLIANKMQKDEKSEVTGGNPLSNVKLPKDGLDEFATFPDIKLQRPGKQKGKDFLNKLRKWRPNKLPPTLTKDMKPWKIKLDEANDLEDMLLKNIKPEWMSKFKKIDDPSKKYRKITFSFG